MDRDEASRLLRGGSRGIGEWNRRRRDRETVPNLKKCDLSRADLRGVDLSGTNLRRTDLRGALLARAKLRRAVLHQANLCGVRASESDLRGADLSQADLSSADFSRADLRAATLNGATLIDFRLHQANMNGARFDGAVCQGTKFCDVNLSAVEGLETVHHLGPTEVSTSTIRRSRGRIPDGFMRGCGFSDWLILAMKLHTPDLSDAAIADIQERMIDLRIRQGIQATPMFISYCEADSEFVTSLEAVLAREGLRHWHDRHSREGDPSERQVERILSLHPTVLLVLSEHTVKSNWVEIEVRKGRGLRRNLKRDVLVPVAIDEAWRTHARRKLFRQLFDECAILDLSDCLDLDLLAQRLRVFLQRQRLSVGTRDPDSRSSSNRLGGTQTPNTTRANGI